MVDEGVIKLFNYIVTIKLFNYMVDEGLIKLFNCMVDDADCSPSDPAFAWCL